MSSTTAPTGAPASASSETDVASGGPVSPRAGTWRVVLIVSALVLVVAVLASGSRPASLGVLHDEIRTGEVAQVRLVGAPEPGTHEVALVLVEWHDGLLHRRTSVMQTRADGQRTGEAELRQDPAWRDADAWPAVTGDLTTLLRSWTSDGDLTVTTAPARGGTEFYVARWFLPQGLGFAVLAWWLCALVTLVNGPEPRLATRWAWFWLWLGAAPLAVVLYPVLGLPRAGRPLRPAGRRLTGGWAFLLAVVLVGAAGG